MTRTISAGDADLSAGFAVASGVKAVSQRVRQRLLLHRGEAFLDAEAGIRYVPDLIGQRLPSALARSIIGDAIREVTGVDGVDDIDVTFDDATRRLRITAEVIAESETVRIEATL